MEHEGDGIAMAGSNYTEGYLKGYEDAIKETWNEVVKMTNSGLTPKEISVRAKAIMATVYQKLDSKRHELGKTAPPIVPARGALEQKSFAPQRDEMNSFSLVEGTSYLVKEPKFEKSLKLFLASLARNVNGLCITRTDPAQLKNSFNVNRVKVFWLTKPDDTKCTENYVQPDLSSLQMIIKEFMGRNSRGVIMIEGLNYIISNNNFNIVLRFIQAIRDDVAKMKCTLIIPLEPGTMEQREYKLLECELQVI
jgi:hypothetical protein